MSIKAARKIASRESPEITNPHPYVVAESEIRELVGSLSVHDLSIVAAQFQVVADLTQGVFEEKRDQLDSADLALIKRIAGEGNSKDYRRIMSAIIASVAQGQRGINGAYLTASLVVHMIFRWSPEYRLALDSYRHRLRRQRRNEVEKRLPRGAGTRLVLCSANDP